MTEAKEKALKILDKNEVGVLATVSGNKPVARYMDFKSDDFVLYTVTDKRTEKVEDIEANNHAFVLIGYEEGVFDKDYLEIEATVSLTQDQDLIDQAWNDYMDDTYKGKDDPNILVLKLTPQKVTLKLKKDDESIPVAF
ncbi:pyridoxamine 5'-phosphate oxidase family protein [Alkalibacterium pelagium]|uniref:General stress protein 26 n=1 Tax=Alkalibacterium pelagium TaxID=426702 RepID=A0A1H7M0I2_9LACT|nr:pyridoxamine 5'-phosphate oxidase family protein [Alkalibacterium pelagium]GEN51020.1 general stress protein 26 [Alkalibacterium pelagium]SEL04723.1 General stress protein 26 [Alkalibacterium pelagium]